MFFLYNVTLLFPEPQIIPVGYENADKLHNPVQQQGIMAYVYRIRKMQIQIQMDDCVVNDIATQYIENPVITPDRAKLVVYAALKQLQYKIIISYISCCLTILVKRFRYNFN